MKTAELVKALLDVDEEVFLLHGEINPHPTVVIVGGAAFLLRVADSVVRQVMASYPNINGAVASYGDQIPYNFEDRLVPINIPSRTIDYMTPCTEDLAVMKLYASRPNDIQDIDGAAQRGLIDWELLEKLVYDHNEASASALSPNRYKELVYFYEQFKRKWGQQ